MKKIQMVVWAFCLFTFIPVMAQEKKSFTLEDLMPGGSNFYNLQPENLYTAWWGDRLVKLDVEEMGTVNMKTGKISPLLQLEEVQSQLKQENLGHLGHFYYATFLKGENQVLLHTSTHEVVYDLERKAVVRSVAKAEGAANAEFDPTTRHLAYTLKNNLFVNYGGEVQQVTDEPDGVVCGRSVHRDEFGITKGIFWSPKGTLLAFYRMDQSMVTDYPQVNTTTRIATLEPDKYPMAGMTSHKVTVGIYNPATKATLYLQAGDPTDRYFTNIAWSPDEKNIYMIELNRDQNHASLVRYNASTGEREAVLYEEKHPKYVEPMHPIMFLPWDDHKFIYQSQRSGYNHLYLFDLGVTKGEGEWEEADNGGSYKENVSVSPLTSGDWLVQDLVGFCPKTKEVIILSTEISPLQSNPFAVSVKNRKSRLLGCDEGVHHVTLSESGSYLADNYSSSSIARRVEVLPVADKGRSLTLLEAENPMDEYNLPEITLGTLPAADGETELYYRLVKPVNFDPAKKYPAIIYVYGGPHAQLINDVRNYGAGGWDVYMAQLGYVMLTVDNRGSDNRGLAFENCTFRQLGTEEMKDQMQGVELLKALPYVDQNRIGVHGWSFGGFMTTNLMLTHNDVFKVGVAGGPVIDWAYYEVMYGERYMDTPESNPEGYKNANLTLRAGDLKGRLQLIIGANDPTCVPQHSITFLRACIDAGTQPDFFVYPGDGHNMYGRDRVHLYERITRYFEDHLK